MKNKHDMSENSEENMENDPENQEIIPGYNTLEDFTKEGYQCLMDGIRQSNALPTGRDWNFYTTFKSFTSFLHDESHQILNGVSSVLKGIEVEANIRSRTLEQKTEMLIEANDILLEKVEYCIDEMNGLKVDHKEPVVLQTVTAELPLNTWDKRTSGAKFSVSSCASTLVIPSGAKTIRLLTAENIVRPQKFFKDTIDNRSEQPWEPRIKEKPNSLKPLAIFLEETSFGKEFSHPYEYELDRFTPPENSLCTYTTTNPKPIDETPLIEIDEPKQLFQLVQDLRQCDVIAIDLEHHSYRSFMGFTCLLQISTRDKDYLIDTLALRNDLWVLNEIFTKPSVVKVFHGALSDIQWLQRDLSLYIVNMFDTFVAAKQLEYARLSLAYLLQKFCHFTPNKQYQLADWRIRPLPQELKNYAREDTHYLIYIYENLRNELVAKANGKSNLLKAVIDGSTSVCKKRYFKPVWHENIHMEFYGRSRRNFDNRQLCALKDLYKWRDTIARNEDESTGYVLPNNMLLEIAGRLPKEMQGVLACCSPVPPLVRANLLEIHKLILKALQVPLEQAVLKEDTRARGSVLKVAKINMDSPLYCPHDLSRNEEFRDDLPTLLGNKGNVLEPIDKVLEKTQVRMTRPSMLTREISALSSEVCEKLEEFRRNFKFLSPFQRYKLTKPFIEAKERRLAEEERQKIQDKSKEDRTDEQRIESIREHFLNLAKTSTPPPEMAGVKKNSILRGSEHNKPEVQACLPNLKITVRATSEDATPPSTYVPTLCKREKNRQRMIKRKEKRDAAQVMANEPPVAKRKRTEPQDDVQSYDYSMVDFRQFQGGGKGVEHARNRGGFKTKFRGRGRPNRRGAKAQNRAMSFRGH